MKFSKSLMVGLLSLGMTSTMAVPYAFAVQELPTVTVTARRPNTCTGMCLRDLADQIRQLASEAFRSIEDTISPDGPKAEVLVEEKEIVSQSALRGCQATEQERAQNLAGAINASYVAFGSLPTDGQIIRVNFAGGSNQRFVYSRYPLQGAVTPISPIQGCDSN
jgi:hypothetical protein